MTHNRPPRTARHRLGSATLAAITVMLACLGTATPARAGTYTVTGTCNAWAPWGTTSGQVAVYPACPWLYDRNVLGTFTTPAGVGGGWRFDAPPGTAINTALLDGVMQGLRGWQAAIYTEGANAHTLEGCPGATCPGASKLLNQFGYDAQGASAITTRVRCGSTSGCPNTSLSGQILIEAATVTLIDGTAPSVALAGGSLFNGWVSGVRDVTVNAVDNTGIANTTIAVDGATQARISRGCDYSFRVPCPSGLSQYTVPTNLFADGVHQVAATATDASGNAAQSPTVTAYIDNTAPTQPLGLAVGGGARWQGTNGFDVTWQNPPQQFAPIAAAAYRLCPRLGAGGEAEWTQKRCVSGSRSAAAVTQIGALALPAPGLWDLRLWLVDGAGNQQPASAAEVDGLGYDDTPPADVAFLPGNPQDPASVHVRADDATSGLTAGVIEIRRNGRNAWQPLATQVDGDGLSAFVDDEVLPKGLYFLRARVTNAAGLESSDDRTASGDPATIRLPVRAASRLVAGRPQRRCRRHGGRRRCGVRLLTRPGASVQRSTGLRGRLTVGGKPMAGVALAVWRRLSLPGAAWARIGTVTTSKTGRFSYRVRRGAARTIRFRYPGTKLIRGHNRDIALRVHAAPTFRPSRHDVINGEYVTFSGKLRGGWLPTGGVLVELQVRTRGEWRTFAQPRADDRSGRYSYQYRFETVSGTASFKFRARVRSQPGYPFTTGASRTARVRVHGL